MTNRLSISDQKAKYDKGFLYLIIENLNPIWGLPLGIAGLLIGLFPDYFKENNIITIVIILGLISCGTFLKTAFVVYKDNKYLRNKGTVLPEIIEGRKSYRKSERVRALCILEPSEFFSYGFYCSIYHCDESFEQLIGFGEVIIIQENKFIQVEITNVLEGNEKIIDLITQNNKKCLERLRIKPSIPKGYLDRIQ
jgi:hypothetical protein